MKRMLLAVLAGVILSGCSGPGNKGKKESKYDKWVASLGDSIAYLEKQSKLMEDSINELQMKIGENLKKFKYVDNSREVEGYTILNAWASKYPLTSTGLISRLTKSEQFELIAALGGGSFNQISVSTEGETCESEVVPYDQALNYRSGGLNTVAFSGPKADAIGRLIYSNMDGVIALRFLPGRSSVRISEATARMIGETWAMYNDQKNVERMERTLPFNFKKIDAYRRIINSGSEK